MTDDTSEKTPAIFEKLSSTIQELSVLSAQMRQLTTFPVPTKQDSFKRRILYRIMRPFVLWTEQYHSILEQMSEKQIELAITCEQLLTEHTKRLDWTLKELQKATIIVAEHTKRLDWTLEELQKATKTVAEHTKRLDWTLEELQNKAEIENAITALRDDATQTKIAMEALGEEVHRNAILNLQIPDALSTRLRIVENLSMQQTESGQTLQAQLLELNTRLSELIDKAHSVTSASMTIQTDTLPAGVDNSEFDFLAWERFTRGSEKGIAQEQEIYAQWFADAPAKVLDAGCGRGEFLEILKAHNIDAYGIDADESMAEHCRLKGLIVQQGDLIDHIASLRDESLGGIFLGHVVEHLPTNVLMALMTLMWKKLKSGAALIMETPNPTCLTMFSGAFYADPTHIRPVHPKTLEFLCAANNFVDMTVIPSAPIPKENALKPLAEMNPLQPVEKDLVIQMNKNLEHLNSVLFSFGNYALAARKSKISTIA